MLHQNPLHGDACLSGISESSSDTALGGIPEIRVAVHYNAGISAQFQYHFLLAGALLDFPAHRCASGKTNHFQSVIGHQQARIVIRKRQHIQRAVGPSRLLNCFSKK